MPPQQITVSALWPSWELSLRAKNRSASTIRNYRVHVVGSFSQWLEDNDKPTAIDEIERRDLEAYLVDQIATRSASTAATRYRSLRVFFRWAVAEGELDESPMDGMELPQLPEPEVPILEDDEIRAMLAVCDGKGFPERRDTAIIRLLVDSGMRSAEIMSLSLESIDLQHGTASVTGKGAKGRTVAYGHKTAQSLDRYLRVRRTHKATEAPNLWLGIRGPMGQTGLSQMLRRRGEQAGVEGVHPHRFRHTFAHKWLAAGGQEGDLQALAGWESGDMIRRYGASAKAERARDAHHRMALGDQL